MVQIYNNEYGFAHRNSGYETAEIGSKSNLAKNMYSVSFGPSPFPAMSNLVGYLYPKWGLQELRQLWISL